jgi:S-adenosylmethionine hydrolase
VSATFHGRDIFASVAAHLSRGGSADAFGPIVTEWQVLPELPLALSDNRIQGSVEFVDHFGNVVTNIPGPAVQAFIDKKRAHVDVGGRSVSTWVHSYGEVAPGTLIALISSMDTLEIAVNQGNAARMLGVDVGAPVLVAPEDNH